jgi:hypothetical protein
VVIRLWTAAVLLVGVSGCAPLVDMEEPSPQGPRISDLQFVPTETPAGCPVRAMFRLESTTEEIVSGKGAWVRRQGRSAEYRSEMLPIDQTALLDKHEGEIETRVVPDDSGTYYYYYVQVGDRSGRRSNVLRATLTVDPAWTDSAPSGPSAAR